MRKLAMLATTAVVVIAGSTVVMTDNSLRRNIQEYLTGNEEVPLVLTTGRGTFTASINHDGTEIAYTLRYSDLQADATQAHIHIGQRRVNGGVSVWLCSNLASPPTPAGVQPCPVREGEIEGVIRAANVVGPVSQGVDPGGFDRFLHALRAGQTYVNVHTTRSPGGEIRTQIDGGNGHH